MSDIVVIGGGVCGLLTAILLAEEGHGVTVLERDSATPPDDPRDAWAGWDRSTVRQWEMGHYFLPRFRTDLERELPAVAEAIDSAGALRNSLMADMPEELNGGWREGDERFEVLTGRRPVVEAAIALAARGVPGLDVRRGQTVTGLRVEVGAAAGRLVGVETSSETFVADLVVDCGGRQSPVPRLLVEAGARPPVEEADDSGFVYYGRTFASPDGSTPAMIGAALQEYDSVQTLSLPADNGTWFTGIIAAGRDREMRRLNDNDRFMRAWGAFPLVAHWLDGEPLTDVKVMGRIEDRIRHFVVDGMPVVTGLAAVGDAWACTNPSVGRGVSMGFAHAVALRDHLRRVPLGGDVTEWAVSWHETTMKQIEPFYRETLVADRHRLREMEAQIEGRPYAPDDPDFTLARALRTAAFRDPDVLRGYIDTLVLHRTAADVLSDPELLAKVMELGGEPEPAPGPTRAELVELIA